MRKRTFLAVLILIFALCVGGCGTKQCRSKRGGEKQPPPGKEASVSVKKLIYNPELYTDSVVSISGFLFNKGKNLFKGYEVVLKDSLGYDVVVSPWLPIEIPPAADPSIPQPETLHDYLGKEVELKGMLRHDKADIYSRYEYYFEVQESKFTEE